MTNPDDLEWELDPPSPAGPLSPVAWPPASDCEPDEVRQPCSDGRLPDAPSRAPAVIDRYFPVELRARANR